MSDADERWKADDAATADYFDALVTRYGVDPRAVDWGSRASQGERFAALAAIGIARGARVLDVGCGTGDLLAWLRDRHIDVQYCGIDITSGMVEAARSRFPEARFERGSVLEWAPAAGDAFDWVVASGIFYRRSSRPFDFMKAAVERLFALAGRGLAFNSLSTWAPSVDADEYHADPLETLAFCRTLTPRVALRHDYHPRDFAIWMRKAA
jgi:SAM-dependent methyltransferase